MLNAIDDTKSRDGMRLFTPAHFDLIIIDESHRSIFKKYRAIFDYFDAIMVGLTATPKTDVDRNTYEFFEMEHGVPTYAYDYETAVQQDHVLVPYYNYEVQTKFLEEGIHYDELSVKDKERFEADFAEDGGLPDFIPSAAMNKFIFNESTVDVVLQDLMERGIKTAGGDRLGKTIIFAQNKRHAEFICQRFDKLYPEYKGSFAQRVICDDAYAQTIIDDFKKPDKLPYIAVSVDMIDICRAQVLALNPERIAVKLQLRYVEKFKKEEAFVNLSEGNKAELLQHIAPLVHNPDEDELAKRFDNFMYGLMLASMEQMSSLQQARKGLCDIARLLERKAAIPQVKEKLPLLREIQSDVFWESEDILRLEKVRTALRELMKFLDREDGKQPVVTHLTDPVIDRKEGQELDPAYDFEDYRDKVNRYIGEHSDTLAIYKLTHNVKLTQGDYQELERVLTQELGSAEDYQREFGDTPFGLLVRKIAKLDHAAAMEAINAVKDNAVGIAVS